MSSNLKALIVDDEKTYDQPYQGLLKMRVGLLSLLKVD